MRSLSLCLPLMLGLVACNGSNNDPNHASAAQTPDCTRIVSPVQRLACFDAVAGTPIPLPTKVTTSSKAVSTEDSAAAAPLIVQLVQRNEATRKKEVQGFLLSRSRDDASDAAQIVISAPALGSVAPRPFMAISCLSGITRLQFITTQSIPRNRLRVRLLMDGKPVAEAAAWLVLDVGNIADAGRGLVAIDTLKQMSSGNRLQTESDYAPLDGLIFDASGLHELIALQREACHW